jgi:hypothetical protein
LRCVVLRCVALRCVALRWFVDGCGKMKLTLFSPVSRVEYLFFLQIRRKKKPVPFLECDGRILFVIEKQGTSENIRSDKNFRRSFKIRLPIICRGSQSHYWTSSVYQCLYSTISILQ